MCNKKISKSLAKKQKLCKFKFKFEPVWNTPHKKEVVFTVKMCKAKADKALTRWIRECWLLNKGINSNITKCLEKGKDYAKQWTKSCGVEIKYNPNYPKVDTKKETKEEKSKSVCRKEAKKQIKKYIDYCQDSHRGKSWEIVICFEKGKKLVKNWRKKCGGIKLRYKPKYPRIYPEDSKKCTEQAYKVLRLYIAGCWKKYNNNNVAIGRCLNRGKKISKNWGKICKSKLKYEPTTPKQKKQECIQQAWSSIRLWERNCSTKYETRYYKFKSCLLEGMNLAQTWSKKCNQNIVYAPTIPDPPTKEAWELEEEAEEKREKAAHLKELKICKLKSIIKLKKWARMCWKAYRGDFKNTTSCLKMGHERADDYSIICGIKVPYKPRMPKKKSFCSKWAKKFVRKYIHICKRTHKGNNIAINVCLGKGQILADKWSRKCGVKIKYHPKMLKVTKKQLRKQRKRLSLASEIANTVKKLNRQTIRRNQKVKKGLKKEKKQKAVS